MAIKTNHIIITADGAILKCIFTVIFIYDTNHSHFLLMITTSLLHAYFTSLKLVESNIFGE